MDKKEIEKPFIGALLFAVFFFTFASVGGALIMVKFWSEIKLTIAENNAKIRQLEVADKATRE